MLILIIPRLHILRFLLSEFFVDALFAGHNVVPLLVLYFLIMALNKESSGHLETLLSTISCFSLEGRLQFLICLRQCWLWSRGVLMGRLLALFLLCTALFFTGLLCLLHSLGGDASLRLFRFLLCHGVLYTLLGWIRVACLSLRHCDVLSIGNQSIVT